MKTVISYTSPDPYVRDAEAIRDTINYFRSLYGPRFEEIWPQVLPLPLFDGKSRMPYSILRQWLRHVSVMAGMAGVRGYPQRALRRALVAYAARPVNRRSPAYERGDADAYYGRRYHPCRRLPSGAISHYVSPADIRAYDLGFSENPSGQKDWT